MFGMSSSRAEHYSLSKAQLKCHLPATVSLALYLSLDYNRNWHLGQLSVFAHGMACWPLACAYYRAPHQVKHQREPSRSSSSCILASFRAETILFTYSIAVGLLVPSGLRKEGSLPLTSCLNHS